ncbi:MAG TPA: glycosyltransferase family 2 protein [Bacteroidales bacterium]|nr:glycosyltransferase family 2 protein [Bacteroidales bacterium]
MISVIVTTYKRSDYLLRCLESLTRQTAPATAYEVIVVDNNSADDTASMTKKFIDDHKDITIRYFLETKQGLSFARNRGISESRGDIVAFIDDDAVAHPDYCRSLAEAAKDYPDFQAFGGRIIPVFHNDTEPDWMSHYVWGMVAKVDLGNDIIPFTKKFPAGCNMAFRKDILDELGRFNEEVKFRSDDRDIFTRLKSRGYQVLYVPDIAVNHTIPAERVSRKGIRKLSVLSGAGEKNRLAGNYPGIILKFFDYLIKLFAAVILSFRFLIQNKPQKTLIIKIMAWSLQGFVGNEEHLLKK